jgi:Zn-dependent protease with chaperone function
VLAKFFWIMAYFAGIYTAIIALMAAAGLAMAAFADSAAPSLDALGTDSLLQHRESWTARIYLLALMMGLIAFYVAIPFVVAGLVAGTGAVLYGILALRRVPVDLIWIVIVVGLGMAWAVVKSVFASYDFGNFGIRKTAENCPAFYAAAREVAARVDTSPADEVRFTPGSGISVHQEGRGPFGIFGVKRRILTVGVATVRFLTVSEFKSILAHEFGHFSHKDTFYARFVYQVTVSIRTALQGMGTAGGRLNYANPFYGFLVLYYKAYSTLACGFARSREFLADRIAAGLFGKDTFVAALAKVATEGALFDQTVYPQVGRLALEGKTLTNLYAAFEQLRDEAISADDRREFRQKILDEKPSVFAMHPTLAQRFAAVELLPSMRQAEPGPASQLFDGFQSLEEDLTQFLIRVTARTQRMRGAARMGELDAWTREWARHRRG